MEFPVGDRAWSRPVPRGYRDRRRRENKPVPRRWVTCRRSDLRAGGWTARRISADVAAGRLVRAREDVYLPEDADADCVAACTVGGRLTCVSELARWGVFVLDGRDRLHVELPHNRSRLRTVTRDVQRHWSHRRPDGWASVDIVDAVVAAVQCQTVRAAIATLDSALHLRLIGEAELNEVFAALPRRFRALRGHLDGRCESGAESLMRVMLRRLGCRIEIQRNIPGVGRVDFLVDGWLIVECDSEAHHSGWRQQKEDRRRDQEAARSGYVTYRAIAEDLFWHPERPLSAVRGLRRRWADR